MNLQSSSAVREEVFAKANGAAVRPRSEALTTRVRGIRECSVSLLQGLEPEDCVIQSMPDASPLKWHLAHTTWFFETFLLKRFSPSYRCFHEQFNYLFNSYYNAVGKRHPRPRRGLLSRPTLREVLNYRSYVDDALLPLLEQGLPADALPILETGLHHEQQHQELMLTDLKHLFWSNPLRPVYREVAQSPSAAAISSLAWCSFPEGMQTIGHAGNGFCYDNELPQHAVFLQPYKLANRLVTNGEFLEFVEDGGYQRPEFWLSDGWDRVQQESWSAPLYWTPGDLGWEEFTLSGMRPLSLPLPVTHVSFYEADAYARWAGARLPTEFEWEAAAGQVGDIAGNFVEDGRFHPCAVGTNEGQSLAQLFGDVWEWTASPYVGYPGYLPPEGALGEYNGKFMCNQMVCRGGSCATSRSHVRGTYRNFFAPEKRWQFFGIRLAR